MGEGGESNGYRADVIGPVTRLPSRRLQEEETMKRHVVYTDQVPPARTTLQAAGLVAGARVEIEAIASG